MRPPCPRRPVLFCTCCAVLAGALWPQPGVHACCRPPPTHPLPCPMLLRRQPQVSCPPQAAAATGHSARRHGCSPLALLALQSPAPPSLCCPPPHTVTTPQPLVPFCKHTDVPRLCSGTMQRAQLIADCCCAIVLHLVQLPTDHAGTATLAPLPESLPRCAALLQGRSPLSSGRRRLAPVQSSSRVRQGAAGGRREKSQGPPPPPPGAVSRSERQQQSAQHGGHGGCGGGQGGGAGHGGLHRGRGRRGRGGGRVRGLLHSGGGRGRGGRGGGSHGGGRGDGVLELAQVVGTLLLLVGQFDGCSGGMDGWVGGMVPGSVSAAAARNNVCD